MASLYKNGNFDNQPNWFHWEVNGVKWGNLADVCKENKQITQCSFTGQQLPKDVDDLRTESERYIKSIVDSCGYKKFAVLLSGLDSEIIARHLCRLQVDVEFWYCKFWFETDDNLNLVKEIAKELNCKLHVVHWDWYTDRQKMFQAAIDHLQPCTVKNTHGNTIEHIPSDRYVFIGSRNIEIYFNARYLRQIAEGKHKEWNNPGRKCFIDTRQFSPRYALQTLERAGTSIFWNNDARCASSIFRDKRFVVYDTGEAAGDMHDKDIFFELWSDCKFKQKTDPWVGGSYVYPWETRYPGYRKSREKACVEMQRRYMRKTYGQVHSVCGEVVAPKFDNLWIFGDLLNIDELL
jgi:hypothetical protein